MTVDDDTPEIDDEWQFGDIAPAAATAGGGGLLQTILDEVIALRDGAQADRIALADALTASFAKIDVELEVLRDQVAALRVDVDASGTAIDLDAVVDALAPHLAALRKAVPTAETAHIAMELSRLRHALIGPDPR
jgi:hypothetical protein